MTDDERRWSWSLRARVAVAFLVTTFVAMLALGFYVQWRVEDTLEQGLRDQLESEMEGLAAVPPDERMDGVQQLLGDIHGQLLSEDGEIVASSTAVIERLIDRTDLEEGFDEHERIRVRDDLGEPDERPEIDNEPVVILVRTIGDQVVVLAIEREEADDAVAAVEQQLVISGPVALALAGVLGYLVAGLGLRPVERMRAQAATISSRSAGSGSRSRRPPSWAGSQ